jgi:hypothetical protein
MPSSTSSIALSITGTKQRDDATHVANCLLHMRTLSRTVASDLANSYQ